MMLQDKTFTLPFDTGKVDTVVQNGQKVLVPKMDTQTIKAESYGWACSDLKIEGVKYKVCVGNVVLSIIFCETLIVPVILTGWDLFEPVDLERKEMKLKS